MVTDATSAHTHTHTCVRVCKFKHLCYDCPGYVKQETMLGYHYQPIV